LLRFGGTTEIVAALSASIFLPEISQSVGNCASAWGSILIRCAPEIVLIREWQGSKRLAQRRGLSNLGPLALIVREQPTVRKAIEVLIQYLSLHSDALCPRLEENDRVVTISRMFSSRRLRTHQALETSSRHVLSNHQDLPR
jgi:hypothetical protein